MKGSNILTAMNDIDYDLINDAETGAAANRRRSFVKPVSLAACVCLLVGAALVLPRFIGNGTSDEGWKSGGINGGINVSDAIVIEGRDDEFSDAEGRDYLVSTLPSVISGLEAFGCDARSAEVSEHGYSHINTGDEGNRFALNFRDYLLYKNGKIIAVVTVVKENGVFSCTPAWGGEWMNDYTDFLREHAGEELVYLYIGNTEAVILPSREVVTLTGGVISEKVQTDVYNYFKYPENTYTP